MVTLYEKGSVLGGQMRLAAVPPGKGDITNMVRNYIVLCEKYHVDVHLNTEVNEDMIHDINPDVLIIATGASPLHPSIKGIENTIDAIDVLDGMKQCGQKVLVIGGGLVGCETADYLGEHGFDVSLVEAREDIAMDIVGEHKIYLLENFKENHIDVHVNCKVLEIKEDGVLTEQAGQQCELLGFDSIVLALGSQAYQPFDSENLAKEVYVLGDAIKARRAIDATREAREIIEKIEGEK